MGLDLRGNAKDGYDDQADRFKVKVKTGSYDVVGIKIQRRTNANKKASVRLTLHTLAAYEPANKEATATNFRIDMWGDWTKKFNADRLAWLLRACGADDTLLADFDANSDVSMVNGITGVPFLMKIEVSERKGSDGKMYTDVEIKESKELLRAKRQAYMDQPDWKKIVGSQEDRIDEPYVAEAKAGGSSGGRGRGGGDSGAGGQAGSPYDDGGDLPF